MDLRNLLSHMVGQQVLVNGTRYPIGQDGIARNVKDEDAAKLLQNKKEWSVYSGELQAEPPAKPPVESPKEPAKTEEPKGDDSGVNAGENVNLPGTDAGADEGAEEDVGAPVEPGDDTTVVAPGVIPEEGQSWPDPTEDMDITYLRTMAEAYGVEFTTKTGRKTLVSKIMKEMYPDA